MTKKTAAPLYKWLLPGRLTSVQCMRWPVEVGEWTKDESPVIYSSGWHYVEEKDVLNHLPSTFGAELWEVEVRGAVVHYSDKSAATSMRLVRLVGTVTEQNLRLFACDVAENALTFVDSPDPRSVAAIEVARRYANGEATESELAAARAAAQAEALAAAQDAAWAAAQAASWAAAQDSAQAAAQAAALAAAWDAAQAEYWAAAWAAAQAAARATYSNWLVVRLESDY